jgi:mono/diheme cytochrome c family protein
VRAAAATVSLVAFLLAGCSLAGDITPPPALATAQAAETLPPATHAPVETTALTAGPSAPAAPSTLPAVAAPAGIDLARGQSIWQEKCAPCHGLTGQSDGVMTANLPEAPPKLGDPQVARDARPAAWYEVVTNGRMDKLMPAFASLSDGERWDAVAYALTLGTTVEEQTRGGELYGAEDCAVCHGDAQGGGGSGPSFLIPGLAEARSLTELAHSIRAGSPPAMPAYAEQLTEDDVWAMAAFVRSIAWGGLQAEAQAEAPVDEASAVSTIRGTVTNGSPGGDLPGGLEITLSGFDGEQEAYNQSSSVAADGGYAFSDVPVVAGRIYGVTVAYGDILYFSDGAHLTGDPSPMDLPVTVFDTTTDTTPLSIERLHVLFDFSAADQVQVVELWVVSNMGDHTVVAEPSRGILEVSLPEGAADLGFEDGSIGDRYILTADGFGDTQPVVPGSGTSQFIFSYRLPYDGKITFRQPSKQPIQAVVVLLPQNGVTAEGGGLQDQGQQQMGGQAVHSYSGGAIAAGQALEFELSGSPQTELSSTGAGGWTNTAIGLAVLGALVILGGLWWFRPSARNDRRSRVDDTPGEDQTEALLRAIAELDDALDAGQIDAAEHRTRREALKHRLREQMR